MHDSLLDKFLCDYWFRKKHQIEITASPQTIYSLMRDVDFNGSTRFRFLFGLRGMPKGMHSIQGFLDNGLVELESIRDKELVIGAIGSLSSRGIQKFSGTDFIAFNQSGAIKLITNYVLKPLNDQTTLFTTETRFVCFGVLTTAVMAIYWVAIRYFSGVIRMEMLRLIKQAAETGGVKNT